MSTFADPGPSGTPNAPAPLSVTGTYGQALPSSPLTQSVGAGVPYDPNEPAYGGPGSSTAQANAWDNAWSMGANSLVDVQFHGNANASAAFSDSYYIFPNADGSVSDVDLQMGLRLDGAIQPGSMVTVDLTATQPNGYHAATEESIYWGELGLMLDRDGQASLLTPVSVDGSTAVTSNLFTMDLPGITEGQPVYVSASVTTNAGDSDMWPWYYGSTWGAILQRSHPIRLSER